MAKVNIIIKGISMIYHKDDDIWKILFPFGECHLLKFKQNENDPGLALASPNRQIEITAQNASSEFEIGESYSDFLDLTAEYSHANGVKLQSGWENRAVLMTLENAKISVDDHTENPHILLKGSTVMLEPTNIGYSAKAEIEGDEVIVNVSNHPDFPKVFDQDCTLIFDNDCGEGETRQVSDFQMVYSVIEIMTSEEQFTVETISKNSDLPIVAGTKFEGEIKEKYKDSLVDGLPCHIVKISKTENLV
jgi:hypothetical protein